jgi:uncharacterized repeat protein (TIGR03803 family)
MKPEKHSAFTCTRAIASVASVVVVLVLSNSNASASGPVEKVLYNFHNGTDGAGPYAGLIPDKSGNLYGTTFGGGTTSSCVGCGTVFELSAPVTAGGPWVETVLYTFNGGDSDGVNPNGALVFDSQGNLYGATTRGGPGDEGTVFELSPPTTSGGAWTESVLYIFPADATRGAYPAANLAFGPGGNLYGTTVYGGNTGSCRGAGCGVVFELTRPSLRGGAWTQKVLYSFGTVPGDGSSPTTGVIFDPSGALYGAAGGIIFQLVNNQGTWTENVVYAFPSGGINGPGFLRFGSTGSIYGIAYGTGSVNRCTDQVCGGVFQITPPVVAGDPWTETTLYVFTGGVDGANPSGTLSFDKAGNIYGTAARGGLAGNTISANGTVFELSPPAAAGEPWTETTLHAFRGSAHGDGTWALGGLISVKGKFYGTTTLGGSDGVGEVFSLVVP